MATRQDEMIAEDVCRFANIVNDLLDCASYIARNIDPNTGDVTVFTVEEIKAKIASSVNSITTVYYPRLIAYIDALTLTRIQDALTARAIDAAILRADIVSMKAEADWIVANLASATTYAQLISGANHIDANIPKLPLFRRLWAL